MSAAFPSLSEALAAISLGSPGESVFSLAHLPVDVLVGVAEYQDHESLVGLGATCSSFRQLVHEGFDPLWKALHDKRWTYGKRLRFNGPPSRRPRDGVVVADASLPPSWREEYIRRSTLDKSVPELLARLPQVQPNFDSGMDFDERNIAVANFQQALGCQLILDGAEIYDAVKLLRQRAQYQEAAEQLLVAINRAEAKADWDALFSTHAESGDALDVDGLMIISKFVQQSEDLVMRSSSDEIYDEMNRMMDALTLEGLMALMVTGLSGEESDVSCIFLDKALKHRKVDVMVAATLASTLVAKMCELQCGQVWENTRMHIVRSCLDSRRFLEEAILLDSHFRLRGEMYEQYSE